MLDSKKLGKFARYLNESLPKVICGFRNDLDSMKIRQILKEQFDCIDFITKDEFNIQTKKLLKLQEQLKQLEKRIEYLECILDSKINKSQNDHESK